ncbi:MAG: hypothetical protein AAB932_01290, partial [Patescibacteria group bacterium]
AQLLGSADYAIFWFDDSVLTSSSIILSLSYGLPVICRRIPAAEKIRDGINGYVFDATEDLQELLKRLPSLPKPKPQDVITSVAHDTPELVAEQFMNLCKTL